MITLSEVYLSEMASTQMLVKQVNTPVDGIIIIDYHHVQLSIVNAHSKGTIFFPYEQH